MLSFEAVEVPHTVPLVWEGCVVESHEAGEAADALTKALELRHPVHMMGCTETLPNPGDSAEESGGRVDLFFAIADEDVPRAAVLRTRIQGMRWAMDVDPDIYHGPAKRVVAAAR